MAVQDMDPGQRRKIVGWIIVSELFVGLGVALWGQLADDWRYLVIGLLVAGQSLLVAVLLSRSVAAKDPQAAKRMDEARARARNDSKSNARMHLIALGVGLAVFVGALMVRRYLPGFSALPKSDQRLYLMLGVLPLVVLGNLAWMAWKKRRASAKS